MTAWILHWLPWIIGVAAACGVVWMLWKMVDSWLEADERRGAEREAVAARADQQRAWVMEGDAHGGVRRLSAVRL